MKNLVRILHRTMRIALLLAFAGAALQSARGQTCELWTVDSTNGVYENGCIAISNNEVSVSNEVSTQNYDYVVDVAAAAYLSDNSGLVAYVGPICTTNGDYEGFSSPCGGSGGPGDDIYVATEATYDPTQLYSLTTDWGECYDSSGEGGWGPPEYGGSCGWSYSEGDVTLSTNQFNPAYQIATLLYSPPGNQSKSGFGSSTTNGTTTTVGNSFTSSSMLTYSGGIPMVFSAGGSYENSNTTSNSNTFTEQFIDATSITTDDNSNSAYNIIGLNGTTLSDTISHHLDTFEILLNPQATVVSDANNNLLGYSVATQPLDGSAGQPDMLGIVAKSMESNDLYPSQLNPQEIANPNGGGNLTQPGMAAICANVNQSEYQAGSCTQSDQCGCQTSDYNTILSADALLGWNSSTEIASPYAGTTSPLEADASGVSNCLDNPGPNYDCRYVIIPSSSGSTTPLYEPLSGDQGVTYSITDQTTDTQTIGTSHSYSVSIFAQVGPAVSNVKVTNTWTWTDFSSTGVIDGNSNSQSVLLQTSTASCDENVSLYEDTVYHSFVFQIPTGNFGCN
jgi:hypothetical protein